jgi:hypothetical protein
MNKYWIIESVTEGVLVKCELDGDRWHYGFLTSIARNEVMTFYTLDEAKKWLEEMRRSIKNLFIVEMTDRPPSARVLGL